MAEIVNLKLVRKAKARAERAKEAEANRLKFGRPTAETERKRLEEARAERAHEAHKLDDEPA
ncbi:MAG: DUF4169 family protein [Alphaproteobacteria bacterium]|nr:DUF4169 family protein [Alphaproteobacteria bacterium]